ncbi:DUF3796 domain-containing protein [Oscillospiraceae bacterium LTW-04]|nr:DUF3796 domain-containing protein [Oscillospiraceae bacterium MB24-C1]
MIKKQFFCGFFGFLGFVALRYFVSGDILDLGFIGCFAFFANFFIAKIKGDKADERYIENRKEAMAFTFNISTVLIFSCWVLVLYTRNSDIAYVLLPFVYAVIFNIYGIKLYSLEEK